MTENKSKNEKCSQKQEFNVQSGFINNHSNILTFEEITKNGHKLSTYEACRLLNQLYEENEGLKHHLSELQGQNEILTKKNEELKKENKELQITKNFWKEQCGYRVKEHKHHYLINHCRCTADDFIHELTKGYKGLQKENEELKQENHDIKHTLEELYYTYIYKPSENYDEDSCDKIIRGILKGVENYEDG